MHLRQDRRSEPSAVVHKPSSAQNGKKNIAPRTLRIAAVSLALLTVAAPCAHAQFDLEESHTTASLRGIVNVGGGVAWASGSNGTVRRSEDGGYLWQVCTTPPGAEDLDFRGIQAWDADTAIVMSSGKGDLSRLYKTTDGCQTWHLLYTNPDKEGFWDYLHFIDRNNGILIGDPAVGFDANLAFRIRITHDGGRTWAPITDPEAHTPGKNLMPLGNEGLFAASNTSAVISGGMLWIGTGGGRILRRRLYADARNPGSAFHASYCAGAIDPGSRSCGIPWVDWTNTSTPLTSQEPSAGIFSLAFRTPQTGIAVGGDYKQPNQTQRTAAWSTDGGKTWQPAQTPPHGYRSAVAWDPQQKLWIATGPNGTDLSTDDGRNWRPLKPSGYDVPGTDKNWNALSLPFVVGSNGRIGRLREISPGTAKP